MTSLPRGTILAALLITACTSNDAIQEPDVIRLAGPAQRLDHGFSSIHSVLELNDGRVLVTDEKDRDAYIADFRANNVAQIARKGEGPLEYSQPLGAFRSPDGTIIIQDPGNSRFLVLAADGVPAGTWQPEEQGVSAESPKASLAFQLAFEARAIDSLGRIYFETAPKPVEEGQSSSIPIVRFDRISGRIDTAAIYTLTADMQPTVVERDGQGNMTIHPRVWPPRVQWTVTHSGAVAVVRPDPYSVALVHNRVSVEGKAVPVEPLPVSAADRAAVAEDDARISATAGAKPGAMITEGHAPRSMAPAKKSRGSPIIPETKPPFLGRDAVRADPDGRIWVRRSRDVSDSQEVHDVFASDGNRAERIALPLGRQLIAFSDNYIYLTHFNDVDLEFIERYPRTSSTVRRY